MIDESIPRPSLEQLPVKVEGGRLVMWVIYDNPRDYPGEFVARKWVVKPGETLPRFTYEVVRRPSLEQLRVIMVEAGLARIPRATSDEAQIVETWL